MPTNSKQSRPEYLSRLFMGLFDDVLKMEELALKNGQFSDLSITEIHTIEAIGLQGPRTMSEISEDLSITTGTLTTAVSKMENKGYLVRQRSLTDRRVVNVLLTRRGRLVYRVHRRFHNQMVIDVLERLNEEQTTVLIDAVHQLSEYFKEFLSNLQDDQQKAKG